MRTLCDILSYAVMIGGEFAVLCAITRVSRGWLWQLCGLAALVGVNALMETWYRRVSVPQDLWLAANFFVVALVFAALVAALARGHRARRLFLAVGYMDYVACYGPVFHLLVYRNILGLPELGACLAGLAVAAAANVAFVFWVMKALPRETSRPGIGEWLAVGALGLSLFASGLWPVSAVTASARYLAPFVLASVVAWVVFPLVFRILREHRREAAAERNLARVTEELQARREALDLARRLRHDQRHHRAQIAEYMLAGQYDRAFDYLKALDEEAQEAPTDKFVWCENETVNAILSSHARMASAAGVALVAEVQVERTMPLADVELVAVLANLLENAINAAARGLAALPNGADDAAASGLAALPNGADDAAVGRSPRERRVTVKLRQRAFGLGIAVTNPVPEGFALSARGLPCEEPGIGMESIRHVVEKYHGQWTYALKGEELTCRLSLVFG